MSIAMQASKQRIDIVDTMPKPQDLPDGTIYGNYACVLPTYRKVIPFHHAVVWDDRVGTQTSFTREFLKTLGRRKIRGEEFTNYLTTRPPMYVRPAMLADAVYMDLQHAYPSIYKFLGWQSDYVRGKYWGVGDRLDYPFPDAWKAGRSFVITGARHLQFGRTVYKGKIETKPFMSPYSNPPLVAGVYDVLSAVARFAVYALGAVYWNIDGGIMSRKAVEIFSAFCVSIGLQANVKYTGDATVLTGGYWKIGGHETANWQVGKQSHIIGGDYIPLDKQEAEWVIRHFQKFSTMKG